jgi:hypothetical protein
VTTQTIRPDEKPRDPSAWLLLHCFVGPTIGTFLVLVAPLLSANPITAFGTEWEWQLQDYAALPVLLLIVLLLGWFFGFIPALLHAVAMLLLRRVIASRRIWLALTPFVGWLTVFAPLLVLAGIETPDRIMDSAWMALIGSAAAIGCMAIAWRRNIYPAQREMAGK